jgi:hypothetical protein
MARTLKAAVSSSTAVTNWEEEMAAQAKVAAAQEAHVGGGNFFSTRAGVLSVDSQSIPNNEMAVLIVDGILENVYYEGKFDPDDITPPSCFAFGRDDADMAPHETVVKNGTAQHDTCKGCDKNEFGSSDTGKGKACSNRRRLALLPAGSFDKRTGEFTPLLDPAHYAKTEMRYLKVPPTSIGAYAAYVKQLAGGIKRPPHGVFTRISLAPHPKKQFEVKFEALAPVPNEVMGAVMERHKLEMSVIEFPYTLGDGSKKEAPKTTGRKFTRR